MPEKAAGNNKNVSFRKTPQHQKTQNPGSKTKGQSNKPTSAPVQVLVPRHEVGVKESLVWRSNSAKKVVDPDTQARQPDIFIPRKPELGRAKQRGYVMPADDSANAATFKDTNGTVIEALRGWPGSQRPPQKSILDQYLEEQAVVDEQQRKLNAARAANKAKSSKTNKNKRKAKKEEEPLVVELDESSEPVMPELISHRFLYENLVREAEERRARQALEEAEDGSNDGSGPIEVKTNRAAQLRAIHLGTKVTVSPKDMWQLSQFKNSAQSQLDTFRRVPRNA